MTADDGAPVVVPANEASWEDVQTVFGTRGQASRCRCGQPVGWCAVEPRTAYEGLVRNNRVPRERQGYPMTTRNAILEEFHVGTDGVFAAAGSPRSAARR